MSTNSQKDDLHHAIINQVSEETVSKLHDRGLLALYLGGTFLTPDQLPSSDIDLLGIVAKAFDFCEEDHLNRYFDEFVEPEFGIKSCFRGITISELQGGNQKGNATSWIPIRIMIKQLSFHMHFIGRRVFTALNRKWRRKIGDPISQKIRNQIGLYRFI